jgi:hypothetical protein
VSNYVARRETSTARNQVETAALVLDVLSISHLHVNVHTHAIAPQSKELVEGAPKTVLTGLVKEDAVALAEKLNAAGGTAVVE